MNVQESSHEFLKYKDRFKALSKETDRFRQTHEIDEKAFWDEFESLYKSYQSNKLLDSFQANRLDEIKEQLLDDIVDSGLEDDSIPDYTCS